jgi:hypothetical protein
MADQLWRNFSALSDAQTYAGAQTLAACFPAGDVTDTWCDPVLLVDGSYVVMWCPGTDDQPADADPNTIPWPDGWVIAQGNES